MTQNNQELKPCPWCGGKARDHEDVHGYTSCQADVDLCHFSGFAIERDDWQNAYCWKRLEAAEKVCRALRGMWEYGFDLLKGTHAHIAKEALDEWEKLK